MATASRTRERTPTLTIKIENKKPIELLDLTASLSALGQNYEEFVFSHGYDPKAGNVRLYITELRSGSIIAELQSLADQASFVLDHLDVFAGFVTNLDDLIKFFLNQKIATPEPISKIAAEQIS
jgi:hypothetical protein